MDVPLEFTQDELMLSGASLRAMCHSFTLLCTERFLVEGAAGYNKSLS
jgi:hypothetical protein